MKFFDIKEIDRDIEAISKHLGQDLPDSRYRKLSVFLATILIFIVNWKLASIVTGGFLFLALTYTVTRVYHNRIKTSVKKNEDTLIDISVSSFDIKT